MGKEVYVVFDAWEKGEKMRPTKCALMDLLIVL